jgi:hypothetical protein
LKIKTKRNKKIKKNEKKISNFKCNKVSVLVILVFIPKPPILEIVPQK